MPEIKMAPPVLGDGDGSDEDDERIANLTNFNAGGDTPICTWSDEPDQKLKAFIVNLMANSDISGTILVENMERVFRWVRECGEIGYQREWERKTQARQKRQRRMTPLNQFDLVYLATPYSKYPKGS